MDPAAPLPNGTIRTARLRLVPLTLVVLEALIDRDTPTAESLLDVRLPTDLVERTESLLRLRMADLRVNPDIGGWLLRAIALEDAGHDYVGLTGFHGPPDNDGLVEVGYEVEPEHRRRGFASEATEGLVEWAFAQPNVQCVVAAIRADNEASLGVVRGLGFQPAGSRWDAVEGTALVFECRRP